MEGKLLLALVLALCSTISAGKVSYDHYRVHKLTPKTEDQLKALHEWEDDPRGFDFWAGASKLDSPVYIMVPPHLEQEFQDTLDLIQLESSVYIDNVQELIENERPKTRITTRALDWLDYYELNDIYAWLRQIVSAYPLNVRLVQGGVSFEGREILGVHISYNSLNTDRIVFLEGGIHAREWISPATVTYIINELVTSTDPAIRTLAGSFDWYIFPVFNPDGYVFTHTTTRLWRKTRTPYFICRGADPNRNWGYQWMQGGASSSPCSEIYAGPSPFSEASVQSMADFITSIGSRLYGYISFHSFTQLLLIPYGHTNEHLDNYDELLTIGLRTADALRVRYGTNYTVGNIAETIYVASGSSVDWVKGTFGTRITYIYELRDLGQFGFLLPANQIIPNCLETMDSLVAMFEEAQALE